MEAVATEAEAEEMGVRFRALVPVQVQIPVATLVQEAVVEAWELLPPPMVAKAAEVEGAEVVL